MERRDGQGWGEAVLAELDERTAVVAVLATHWTDGGSVDLAAIAARAREAGAALVVDASQALGAVPLDLDAIRPDYLVTVGYKWLLGPFALGYLYVAERHRDGVPLEENWISRLGSEDFGALVDYQDRYQPGARRFDVGQRTHFETTPMATAALRQLLDWQVPRIAATLGQVTGRIQRAVEALGLPLTSTDRDPHMLGIGLPGETRAAVAGALSRRRRPRRGQGLVPARLPAPVDHRPGRPAPGRRPDQGDRQEGGPVNTLATYNIKGGVGKTASAVNLAYLAARDGRRTLLWDLDPQGAASYLLRVRPRVKGGGKALVRGKRSLDQAVKITEFDGLDLVPADFTYRNLDLVLDEAKKPTQRIARLLGPMADAYDVVVLDCPPGISLVSENVVHAADTPAGPAHPHHPVGPHPGAARRVRPRPRPPAGPVPLLHHGRRPQAPPPRGDRRPPRPPRRPGHHRHPRPLPGRADGRPPRPPPGVRPPQPGHPQLRGPLGRGQRPHGGRSQI